MRLIFLLLALTVTLAGCKRQHGSASRLTAGTWKCELDYPSEGHYQSTMTLDSEGRYACNGSVTSSNWVRAFTVQGIMKVEEGFVVDTMTNHSNTNAVLPHTTRAKIISLNEDEIVAKWEGLEGVESTMRRVK